jgi:Tol biopolymer transport system component
MIRSASPLRSIPTVAIVALSTMILAVPGAAAQASLSVDSLVRLTTVEFKYPHFSPDGSRILFQSNETGTFQLYVMNADGGGVQRLTNNGANDRMASWSPHGAYIAFISDRDGEFEVFRMRPDGSEQEQLTHDEINQIHPFWSPDGKEIIYNAEVAGRRLYAIHVMNPDGSNDRTLLEDDELNSFASLSPDGALIVFDKWVDNDDTNGELFVMNRDGSGLRRLTHNQVYDGYPTWHPDSRHVIYSSQVEGRFKLFSVDIHGGEPVQLTDGPWDDVRPDVSADGRWVTFNRDDDGDRRIWRARLRAVR